MVLTRSTLFFLPSILCVVEVKLKEEHFKVRPEKKWRMAQLSDIRCMVWPLHWMKREEKVMVMRWVIPSSRIQHSSPHKKPPFIELVRLFLYLCPLAKLLRLWSILTVF